MEMVMGNVLLEAKSAPRKLNTTMRSCIALVVACCILPFTTGCTNAEVKDAVAQIANAIPTVQPYIATASAVAQTLDPGAALLINGATTVVQTALTQLQVLLTAYAQSPSATAWGSIVDAINVIVNQNATALLDAAHIVDPASRARAVAVLGAVQTALLLIYAIVQRVHDATTQTQVKAQAATRAVKMSQIRDYLDRQQVERALGVSFDRALAYETAQGF
jgi:hypothetical protein